MSQIGKQKNRMDDWQLTAAEKDRQIVCLTDALPALRAAARVTQNNLANAIGVSRQTYNAVESQKRKMTWNTYLSLLLFFDCSPATHDTIRTLGLFPFLAKGKKPENEDKPAERSGLF